MNELGSLLHLFSSKAGSLNLSQVQESASTLVGTQEDSVCSVCQGPFGWYPCPLSYQHLPLSMAYFPSLFESMFCSVLHIIMKMLNSIDPSIVFWGVLLITWHHVHFKPLFIILWAGQFTNFSLTSHTGLRPLHSSPIWLWGCYERLPREAC